MKTNAAALFMPFLLLALAASAAGSESLPGTQALTMTGDLSAQMHEAAHRDMERRIADSVKSREQFWHRDGSSAQAYERSVAPNRARFTKLIGVVDARVPVTMERFGDDANPALVAETKTYRVFQVRWPVLEGVHGEGLLMEPKNKPKGFIIALPDADQTPEQIAGLAPGVKAELQFARRFAKNGYTVIVPVLIDRSDAGSGNATIAMTNEPHREWIHRQAYMMGRHIIGYEVQKVLAAVDWVERTHPGAEVRVMGCGEGGLIAFYSAAADVRIRAARVSGYFKSRQRTWEEPLYRNVWGLLREFGDAEIASLIAPRELDIEYSPEPAVHGPPPADKEHKDCGAPGKLTTPSVEEVKAEFDRMLSLIPKGLPHSFTMSSHLFSGVVEPSGFFGRYWAMPLSDELPVDQRKAFDPMARQLRQMRELEAHVQSLVRVSDHTRDAFFLHKLLPEFRAEPWTYAQFPAKQADAFVTGAKEFRKTFWEEIIGKIADSLPPPNPRTRKIYDEPTWTGYEVVLDVGGEGFAWGVLLLPKDLKPGEKRPVVVCQHGRNGVPADVISTHKEAYHDFAARLAERGFIVLAPHNLYKTEALYRMLSRKGNTVKLSMFSVILRHHEQWLNWLETLPNVDAKRIAFYGLSYGGESAMRLPSLLERYCLSVCSGDFNDWTRKVASTDDRHSFMFTGEWEMPYFNMGNTFSYAELSWLIFPRPFMVERGHHDGVAPDAWVASEYAKTRWLYAQFGLADRTQIEFFNGGHTINGQGTFEFLHRHLDWPVRAGDSHGNAAKDGETSIKPN
jgi:dienelactone hydrolase